MDYEKQLEAVINYIKSGEKLKEDFTIGMEMEHFIVDKDTLKTVSYFGVNEFVDKCNPKVLFPMHFTKDPTIVDKFIDTHDYEDCKIVNMKKEHDTFQVIIK